MPQELEFLPHQLQKEATEKSHLQCVANPDVTQDFDNSNRNVVLVFQKIQIVRNHRLSPLPKSTLVSRRIHQGGLQGSLPQIMLHEDCCRWPEETYESAIPIGSLILLFWRLEVVSRYLTPHLWRNWVTGPGAAGLNWTLVPETCLSFLNKQFLTV